MDIIEEEIANVLKLLEKPTANEKEEDEYEVFSGYKPVYPFNTENIASVYLTYSPYIKGQDVLTVIGSGDSILDLFLQGARSITCFDSNKTAKHYAALKFAAVKAKLSFEEFSLFFFAEDFSSRLYNYDIYLKIRESLPDAEKKIWDAVYLKVKKDNIEFNPRKTNITYQQFDNFIGFRCKNWTVDNEHGYFNEENYKKLIEAVEEKSFNDITFIDAQLFDLDKYLQNRKFAFVYLSNIMDFTSTFIDAETLEERLEIFKNFISNVARKWTINNGIVVVSFISKYRQFSNDIFIDVNKYRPKFESVDNFYMLDIVPNNRKDIIIVYCNEKLGRKLLIKHDAFDFL